MCKRFNLGEELSFVHYGCMLLFLIRSWIFMKLTALLPPSVQMYLDVKLSCRSACRGWANFCFLSYQVRSASADCAFLRKWRGFRHSQPKADVQAVRSMFKKNLHPRSIRLIRAGEQPIAKTRTGNKCSLSGA